VAGEQELREARAEALDQVYKARREAEAKVSAAEDAAREATRQMEEAKRVARDEARGMEEKCNESLEAMRMKIKIEERRGKDAKAESEALRDAMLDSANLNAEQKRWMKQVEGRCESYRLPN